jgi:hypothetical protein
MKCSHAGKMSLKSLAELVMSAVASLFPKFIIPQTDVFSKSRITLKCPQESL